jgi:peptidoglycan hydrolase-like protein with peptidoglycan-binding domain
LLKPHNKVDNLIERGRKSEKRKNALIFTLLTVLVFTAVSASYVYESRYGHNTLKRGHQGQYVTNLQIDINATGAGNCGTPDGIFGSNTEIGVREYQRNRNLSIDGQAGYNTKTKLWYEEGQYK